jgi:ubiquinone/menaquinone biosynthesis C-methylase UbiE
MSVKHSVAEQYADAALGERVLGALAAAGLDIGHLDVNQLALVDEFHIGGREATAALGALLDLRPGLRVLDVGSGIGGAARHLAATYGCHVTGIDLTEPFVRLATDLTRRTGLSDRVMFQQGSALALPFEAASFDAATMIHVGMNIEDKAGLFAGVHKVLKPGGIFGIFDIVQMEAGALSFPMPWSSKPETSFVSPPAEYRRLLGAAGFIVEKERVRRDFALGFFREMHAKAEAAKAGGETMLSTQLIMGLDFPQKMRNAVAGVEQGLIAPAELICRTAGDTPVRVSGSIN